MPEIVKMNAAHVAEIAEIEKVSFKTPWSAQMIADELKNPLANYFVVEKDAQVLAYMGYYRILDEAHITNIAVDGEYRRQGIAGNILLALEAEYASRGILYATLEVRVSNTAAHELYLKHGFTDAGVRPGYYEKPREDAYIMWKTMEAASGSR